MRRNVLFVFLIWQLAGALGTLLWQVWPAMGAQLWAAGFLLLFPGNVLAAGLVESLLWKGTLSTRGLSVLALIGAVVINFALWSAVNWLVSARRRRNGVAP